MTKKEVWEKAKEYYKTVVYTKNDHNKTNKENKRSSCYRLYTLTNSIAFSTFINILCLASSVALSLFVFKINFYWGALAGIGTGVLTSIIMPIIIKFLVLRSKRKKYTGFVKMEMDTYFEVMDQFFKSNFKNLVYSTSENDVSKEELEDFINQTKIFADNYKTSLDKYVLSKVNKINKSHYNAIEKLNKHKSRYSAETFNKKINKIIEKNNKHVAPWCKLYNNCGNVCKNLYLRTTQMNSNISMPDENVFKVDPCWLNKKVVKDFGVSTNATLTCQKINTFDIDIKNQHTTLNKTNFKNNLAARQKLHDDVFAKE